MIGILKGMGHKQTCLLIVINIAFSYQAIANEKNCMRGVCINDVFDINKAQLKLTEETNIYPEYSPEYQISRYGCEKIKIYHYKDVGESKYEEIKKSNERYPILDFTVVVEILNNNTEVVNTIQLIKSKEMGKKFLTPEVKKITQEIISMYGESESKITTPYGIQRSKINDYESLLHYRLSKSVYRGFNISQTSLYEVPKFLYTATIQNLEKNATDILESCSKSFIE